MNKNLFDDAEDDLNENNFQLQTNENYAKTYNSLRKKELLQKYKDGEQNVSESDSEDSESSEEDGILYPKFDQDFLKTLASLKSKDPAIYDKNTKFFESLGGDDFSAEENINKESKTKPVTLKEYERKIILEKGGKFVDDSDEEGDEEKSFEGPTSPTLAEEESRLKAEFKKVMKQDDSGDEEFGGIFKKRKINKDEKDKDDQDYLEWLAGKKENIDKNIKEKLESLKNYWSNDKLPYGEKFLRDYVLNKGYTEAKNYNEIPTYEEIVGDPAPLSEDEVELQKQAEFEEKYNFRYEEPDQEFIKRYPRTIETSLRLNDEKRKKKRKEIAERKLQQKQQKLKELEMVKEMKRKEIEEKIEKLKMVTGNDELGFKDDDLEEDFDPDAHDRRMQELFNDDYYQIDEGEKKPECPSDIEELQIEDWDNYDPKNDYDDSEPHCEDEDFNMDCDYDPERAKENLQKELIENSRKRRGGRKSRRNRFMEIIKAEKPVFNPEDEKTYGEYIDEYYKLDCEDIIGDTPCRFKYVETTPNDFGLTIEEILLAKNKELNQWASLKKAIQIRPGHVEKKEQRLYKLKSKNEELKRKIFKSLYGEGSKNENDELEIIQSEEQNVCNKNVETNQENTNDNLLQGASKKAKKKRKRKAQNTQEDLQATGKANSNANNSRKNEQVVENISTKKGKTKEEVEQVGISSNSTRSTESKDFITQKEKRKNKNQSQSQLEMVTYIEKTNPFNKDCSKKRISDGSEINQTKNTQKAINSPNDCKLVSKHNPFAKDQSQFKNCTKESVESLPLLRKNQSKWKTLNNNKLNNNLKSKHRKSFIGKSKTKGDSKDISDERLKAYGINPKKFHKNKKYGNIKQ